MYTLVINSNILLEIEHLSKCELNTNYQVNKWRL
jgi:hypothetical protein